MFSSVVGKLKEGIRYIGDHPVQAGLVGAAIALTGGAALAAGMGAFGAGAAGTAAVAGAAETAAVAGAAETAAAAAAPMAVIGAGRRLPVFANIQSGMYG